ncbi:MAG: phosphate ABC transporter substrate-binding protein PstS [Gemmatimonadaceae bacterium]|nr:phosphate ABC transporter substrate-binding protein PstS [Gemmatimonadaceae bacterium]
MRTIALAIAGALLVACTSDSRSGKDSSKTTSTGGAVALTGAGATFPYPIYSKWFADYASQKGVKINYQSIGSGGGIRQLSEQTVDFGASDSPMSDDEMAKAKGGPIIHVPTVIGAVALIYNLPELKQPLKLDGATLADIYLGTIKKWNDSRIAALNAGVALPATDILVVHRSDGSGTSYIFTDFLSAVSPAWKAGPGKGKEVQWPTGLGAKGNEGVAGQVKQTPGAIGYAELAYAKQNNLATATVRNAAGQFVAPSIESATAAAAGAVAALPANTDYRVSIVNAKGAGAYPITSFTWILLYQNQRDATKGKQLVDFLNWALTDGEKEASSLDYAPLPEAMSKQLVERLKSIKVGGAA